MKGNWKHGNAQNGKKSLTWRSWCQMRRRCLDPKAISYPRYGGRGIVIYEPWLKFANFLADMGDRPVGMSLGRIDNTGNYEPGNCRWETPVQQAMNRRPRNILGERNPFSKLTDSAVKEILNSPTSQRQLASKFGVTPSAISSVIKRKTWKHIQP